MRTYGDGDNPNDTGLFVTMWGANCMGTAGPLERPTWPPYRLGIQAPSDGKLRLAMAREYFPGQYEVADEDITDNGYCRC